MNNSQPLLSIAIPTKNRQKYCIEAIKHILSYEYNDFELVIQDNSDDRQIEDFILKLEDKRLKYVYTVEAISSVENMSRSIAETNGEYVCMIGDDDTILPSIFKYAQFMKEHGVDSISSKHIPVYIWPNEDLGLKGQLIISKYKYSSGMESFDVSKRLISLFKNGIISYQDYFLPRIYHGIVKKSLMDKIYDKVDSYFSGLSPDIYSTIALSSIVKNHVVVAEAMTIAGACPESTSSQSRLGGHNGSFSEIPHLKNNEDYVWDDLIPKFYSVETIWAETAIKAARDFGLKSALQHFNLDLFNRASLSRNRGINSIIFEQYFLHHDVTFLKKSRYVLLSYGYQVYSIFFGGVRRIFLKDVNRYPNIDNIKKCTDLCI